MAGKMIDITGEKHNMLTVLSHAYTKNKRTYWKCKCDCGNIKVLRKDTFTGKGGTVSCGCYAIKLNKKRTTTHGKSNTKLYRVYHSIIQRCNNKNDYQYKNYGARGIKVCEEWENDFLTFYEWSIENGYEEDLTIDRIDNDGDYKPSNCRWIPQSEQLNNTRRNRNYTFRGKTMNINQWARYTGINKNTLYARLTFLGWSVEKSITTK